MPPTGCAQATLDRLSNGRFLFGIGGGWNAEEMENHGTVYKTRWRLLRERVLAMKEIWTKEEAEFHGEFVNFDNAVLRPAPTKGSVPIIVGGDSPAAMRRAARYGDGWYGWWAGVELEAHLDKLRAIMAAEGCEQGPNWSLRVGLPIGHESPDEVAAMAAQAKALGVDEFVVGAGIPSRDFDQHLRRWADAVATAR